MRPTLRQLEYAVAVAEEASFSRAAARCFVSQPSLSNQIRQLELQLGVDLFERTPRGVLVTDAGRAVVDLATELLATADRIVERAQAAGAPLSGELRLGSVSTVTPYILPRALSELRQRFPELRLTVQDGMADRLHDALASGAVDALLMPLGEEDLGFEIAELVHDPFVLAAHRSSPLAALPEPLGLDALNGAEVLLLDDPHCLRGQALALCERVRARPHASLFATSVSAVVQLVRRGHGVTLLPAIAVEVELAGLSEIALKPFSDPPPGRTLVLAWRKGSPRAEELRLLASLLIPHAEAAVALGTGVESQSGPGR